MSRVKPVVIPNFQGGLNTAEASQIEDNQLSRCQNYFFNAQKRLQKRYGRIKFKNPIPDGAVMLNTCDSIAGFAVVGDATNLSLDSADHKLGSGAIKFDIDVSLGAGNGGGVAAAAMTAVDISSYKGGVGGWVYVPVGAKTNLLSAFVSFGVDVSNRYILTIPHTDLEEGWNFFFYDWTYVGVAGTPVDNNIVYFGLSINYSASYVDQVGFVFDHIFTVSPTSNKPAKSIFEYIEPYDDKSYFLAQAGTVMYLLEGDDWIPIKFGLTEGTQFDFMAYKTVIYWSNGVDNFMSFDGKQVQEHTGANTYKPKYLMLANDVGFAFGDPTVPSTLAYTNAAPSNMNAFPNAIEVDRDSSDGKGRGLLALESLIVAGKERKLYKVNVSGQSVDNTDYDGGVGSHRSITRVENDVFFLNETGDVYSLGQREGLVGSARALALNESVKSLTQELDDLESASAIYARKFKNFYLFANRNGSVPNFCLVRSVLTNSWTEYTGVNVADSLLFLGGSTYKIIASSPYDGQLYELESGFDDDGFEILTKLATKNFDFGAPEFYKDFQHVDVFGLMSENELLTIKIYVDNELAVETEVSGDVFSSTGGGYTLDSSPLDASSLDGEAAEGLITVYPFKSRIPIHVTGATIRIELESSTAGATHVLDKIAVYPNGEPIDIYPREFYF